MLLGGLLATVRAGNDETVNDLFRLIRSRTGLPELAAHVDDVMTTWPEVFEEFGRVDFYLDDSPRQPSMGDSDSKGEHSATRAGDPRSIDGVVAEGESGASGEDLRSTEQSRPSAEEQKRRDSLTDGGMNNRDLVMSDGHEWSGRESIRRHESMGSGSDGSSSAKSYRPPRPWELP